MKKRIKVAFDMDGVLSNFDTAFSAIANKLFGTPIIHPSAVKAWDWHLWYPLSHEQIDELWEQITKREMNFWLQHKPLVSPWTMESINLLSGKVPVYFITSRPQTPGMLVEAQTRGWLLASGIVGAQVLVTSRKGITCQGLGITHVIDDKFTNCLDMAKNGRSKSYLLMREHNKEFPSIFPNYFRSGEIQIVESVEDYLTEVFKEVGK